MSWVSGLPGQGAGSLLLCSTELRRVVGQPGLSALQSLGEEPGEAEGGHTGCLCWGQCRFWDGPCRVRANKPIWVQMYLLPTHSGFRRAF